MIMDDNACGDSPALRGSNTAAELRRLDTRGDELMRSLCTKLPGFISVAIDETMRSFVAMSPTMARHRLHSMGMETLHA